MGWEDLAAAAGIWVPSSSRGRGSRPACPYCGRTMMPGQNGWYCTCAEWNRARRNARRNSPDL